MQIITDSNKMGMEISIGRAIFADIGTSYNTQNPLSWLRVK
jgi:hypothetical protein